MLRKVCKFFLIGFCPYEFFKNSKVDLGSQFQHSWSKAAGMLLQDSSKAAGRDGGVFTAPEFRLFSLSTCVHFAFRFKHPLFH